MRWLRWWLCTCPLLVGALDACGNPRRRPVTEEDATVEDITPPPDTSQDATSNDAPSRDAPDNAMDATVDHPFRDGSHPDASDTVDSTVTERDAEPVPLDVTVPDVPITDSGACSPVRAATAFGAESRVLSRPVWVSADIRGFTATAAVLRDGAENVWLHRVDPSGGLTVSGNATQAPPGREIRGGAFAPEGELYVIAYSSNESGNNDVYLQRVQSNALPIPGALLRITNDSASSESPQVIARRGGLLVAWRSIEAGAARLRVATVDPTLSTVGTAVDVTDPGSNVTSFRLVGSLEPEMYAVVYLDSGTGSATIRLQALTNTAMPSGPAQTVVASADLGDTVDAVARNQDVVVVWTAPRSSPTLHVRRIGVIPGGAGTTSDMAISSAPGPAFQPGITLDGDGYAIGYRSGSGSTVYLAMVRLGPDLALRDQSIVSGAAPGGRVGIAARPDGRYALGWADDFTSGTVTRLLVVQCP